MDRFTRGQTAVNISKYIILVPLCIGGAMCNILKIVVLPPPHAFVMLQFSGILTFLGNGVQQSFQSSPPPWRLLPVGLRGLRRQFWRASGGDWEMSKAEKRRRPVFVWNVFLFAPSLQKGAATYPGTLWRGCLEKKDKMCCFCLFCSIDWFQTRALQISDETSLLEIFTN